MQLGLIAAVARRTKRSRLGTDPTLDVRASQRLRANTTVTSARRQTVSSHHSHSLWHVL
jgi:hypothetical protein